MAAPMVRVLACNCRSILLKNISYRKQFQSEYVSKGKEPILRPQSRTFAIELCVLSPRTYTRSEHAEASPARSAAGAPISETAQSAKSNQVNGLRLGDQDGGAAADDEDVRIYGDTTGARVPYRRQVENEAWSSPDDAPVTAKTVAMKIRKEQILKWKTEGKPSSSSAMNDEADRSFNKRKDLDSKGFRTLRHQVQDLRRFQEDTVATILFRSVIYNEGDLVAIDKPYGLPSHGGPGVTHSVDSLLPLLARKLRREQSDPDSDPRLHPVHRLDKETTGVMLLAKTEATARRLHRMFVRREVGKTYWLVSVGVPDPRTGAIDMPMAERELAGGLHRMGIRPDIGSVYKDLGKLGGRGGTRAVTNFRVMSENGSAALVEVRPETGVKHQIRVHMALGMGCPVLGDHKYSHHDKLAPQRLPVAILEHLGIRQAKARTVPMHLHARQIMLPEFLDGRNLFISTRVPKFFEQNLKRLKLKVP